MFSGVSKSGSPCDIVMMSRPDAASSVASAVIAIVGEGLTRARRSARKAMVLLSRELPTDPNAKGGRCEDGAVSDGHAWPIATSDKAPARLSLTHASAAVCRRAPDGRYRQAVSDFLRVPPGRRPAAG